MKYFLRVFIVLILAAGVIFGMFRYTHPEELQSNNSQKLTTVSKPAATEKNSNRVLLASLEKDGYYLYKGSKGVLLRHGKNEFTFTSWSRLIDAEPPLMRLADFNEDGKDELLIRAVSEKREDGSFIYEIYLLIPKTDTNGKEAFDVVYASKNTWTSILNNNIIEEVRQLKSCNKIIQFAMNTKDKSIAYDKATGIAKSGYAGYARALQNDKGQYMTIDKWTKGNGIYQVSDDNKISVSIDINISYKDSTKVQSAGIVYFELFLNSKNNFQVTERSMVFKANKEYRVSNPKKTAKEPWSYTENNSDKNPSKAQEVIQWIKYSPDFSSDIITQTKDLNPEISDINKIQKIKLTENFAELTAKSGCSFEEKSVNTGEFSVILNDKYDISYTAEIIKTKNGEILKITFDKAYPQSEIKKITINYGAK
ncbi:MAG: hypothetical protein IJ731_03205 [Eubacterium sp.]|nr:hypothetical protein [Eubacterium sp.]